MIGQFADRLPTRLLDFWRVRGWGSWCDGLYRLCDPRPFDALLYTLFEADWEFNASEMTVVASTTMCELNIWIRNQGSTLTVFLENSELLAQSASALIDPDTRKPFSKAFLAGLLIQDDLENEYARRSFDRAVARLGRPAPGEVFGYVPALQLGGEETVENLHKVSALEHFLAELEPLKVTRLSPPRLGYPYGQTEVVRRIGER